MKVLLEIRLEGGYPTIAREIDFAVMPRVGEWVELAGGWCAEPVKSVTWSYSGEEAHVMLEGRVSEEDAAKLLKEGWLR